MTASAVHPVTLLTDVFDPHALDAALSAGHVRVQRHPDRPLVIYNYTEACQYAGAWTPVTLACRGLIVDERTGAVLARPFAKFFNHDQPGAPALRLDAAVTVTDKMDGSLGIVYDDGGGPAVATRGSFTSRVLLGAVEIATGRTLGPDAVPHWPGPVVGGFDHRTLGEALAAAPRAGQEGLVVHLRDTDERVKIKYAEYVRLHRLVTGLTARTVWDVLVNGGDLAALTAPLPDEFHVWVAAVAAELTAGVQRRAAAVERAYADVVAGLPAGWTRRDFAAVAGRHPERSLLFLRLDGRDYRPALWLQARPAADWTPAGAGKEEA